MHAKRQSCPFGLITNKRYTIKENKHVAWSFGYTAYFLQVVNCGIYNANQYFILFFKKNKLKKTNFLKWVVDQPSYFFLGSVRHRLRGQN
jgi:hypothetical protein